ncbi:hypothetical protein IG193_00020 [Infirmifilum lucidum]|uniref:Uncharacterized protein n=1 Tax=Infirmifilum lucidum TaxID=2776706 RepID=A0A7L9FGY4_9CREN|nr:hypothetical protein [Infirmifilum lucidum]QOJ78891.1 hypothetical protein IG193_00020 [Infirmifilum lucidum]
MSASECSGRSAWGFVRLKALVGSPDKTRLKEVEFLVDSSSWYMVLQPSTAEELALSPVARRKLVVADGRTFSLCHQRPEPKNPSFPPPLPALPGAASRGSAQSCSHAL